MRFSCISAHIIVTGSSICVPVIHFISFLLSFSLSIFFRSICVEFYLNCTLSSILQLTLFLVLE